MAGICEACGGDLISEGWCPICKDWGDEENTERPGPKPVENVEID